jgi:amidase
MGGFIRVPAAFNGLYGIKPTSDRIPKGGMQNTNTRNLTIKLSCWPVCHSLADLELLTRIINAHPNNKYDVTSAPVPWRSLDSLNRKLTVGILKWDGAVMPHPPVLRALEHSKWTLEKAGHEGRLTTRPFSVERSNRTIVSHIYSHYIRPTFWCLGHYANYSTYSSKIVRNAELMQI